MDVEWLLSTLFDASLLSPSSRRRRRLFFCAISGQGSRALQNHFEIVVDCVSIVSTLLNPHREV
jgi:hypothetical protein